MKLIRLLTVFLPLLCLGTAHAQWQTTTYTLKGGWSSIYLSGDARYDTLDNIFPAAVTEVWRWNPNPTQVQFTESSLIPSEGTSEWTVWRRGFPADSKLTQLGGQTAYLVKSDGSASTTHTVAIKQSPFLPSAAWVRNGANLMGFPTYGTGANSPSIASYFSTFPAAVAANAKIYKYVGGELGPANPIQIFSNTSEKLDRKQAYWFSAKVVENFYAPLELSLSSSSGLDFGRSGSSVTLRIRNRSTEVVNVTFAPVNSEASPGDETAIAGAVPLTRRIYDPGAVALVDVPLTGAITETIAPQSTLEILFGLDRGSMDGDLESLFASFLRITDSGNLMDVYLPVRAQPASLAGLWIGDVKVSAVESKVAGATGNSTPQSFPLRTLIHVSGNGTARLLSQVFLGRLAVAPNDEGVCTREALLKQDEKAKARRLVAAHLPLDRVIIGDGGVEMGGSLTCEVGIPYNDPTNPFVHQYHPDHDNKDARQRPVGAGVESYDILRTCTFTFTPTPPAGSTSSTGWGSSVIGGTYTETITGVHKTPVVVSGTFELNRASEIGTLSE
ncbi:hypothetical protein JIN84_01575 [Luteolibacter yonseiensis]|uniref:Uncharacterized protein n=1 Tax=Luteolibacter yonseiensis TaxID=1144680 RepID=A0A934V5T7_9BACT|nr:hypothetical protein [Luteolibacter yonseiensis]MBK1814297.1 hypothetical protein [Luteolibacter yonseiensis]